MLESVQTHVHEEGTGEHVQDPDQREAERLLADVDHHEGVAHAKREEPSSESIEREPERDEPHQGEDGGPDRHRPRGIEASFGVMSLSFLFISCLGSNLNDLPASVDYGLNAFRRPAPFPLLAHVFNVSLFDCGCGDADDGAVVMRDGPGIPGVLLYPNDAIEKDPETVRVDRVAKSIFFHNHVHMLNTDENDVDEANDEAAYQEERQQDEQGKPR